MRSHGALAQLLLTPGKDTRIDQGQWGCSHYADMVDLTAGGMNYVSSGTLRGSGAARSSSHSVQSSPNNSTGCCVRMVPFPQRRSSAAQYLSQPQQIRSGCLGLSGVFGLFMTEHSIGFADKDNDDFCHVTFDSEPSSASKRRGWTDTSVG